MLFYMRCVTVCARAFLCSPGASTLAADGMLDVDAEGGWGDDADLMLDEGWSMYCCLCILVEHV